MCAGNKLIRYVVLDMTFLDTERNISNRTQDDSSACFQCKLLCNHTERKLSKFSQLNISRIMSMHECGQLSTGLDR